MAVRSVQESFLGTVGEVSKLDTILTRSDTFILAGICLYY